MNSFPRSQIDPERSVSPNRRSALVTGATGTIGPSLIEALLQRGYNVRAFVRRPPPSNFLPDNTNIYVGDITNPTKVRLAAEGIDVIFHLAGKLHQNNPSSLVRSEYEAVNIGGTQNVIDGAREHGIERVILFSTISVYGPTAGKLPVNEESAPAPATLYARTKLAAEEIALKACSPASQPLSVVLRLAAVYGPHMRGNYLHLLRAIRRGLFLPVGKGDNRRTLVYVEDVVAAAIRAAEVAEARGQIYNVTDGRIYTLRQILTTMYTALNRKPPERHLPVTPVRRLLSSFDKVARLLGQEPALNEAMLDKYLEDVAVSGKKIEEELNFSPQYSLLDGWRKTVQGLYS